MANFIDRVRMQVRGGDGGRGCVSFRREKYVPRGGPNGGNGGRGGDVILVGSSHLGTLLDFTYRRLFRAHSGEHGLGSNKQGASGDDLRLPVPLGTVVRDENSETIVEILENGQEHIVAHGGMGGRGNASFKTSTNRAPRHSQPGIPGEDFRIALELKLIADAGLVGEPNAGKSTMLAAMSAATPEIANYPFTTKSPVLGVVSAGEEKSLVLADIPGLLEGAHEGRGLGLEFLRHIERTRVLLFVLDVSLGNVGQQYELLLAEVTQYEQDLADRPHLLVLNKMDMVDAATLVEAHQELPPGETIVDISALQRRGLEELIQKVMLLLEETRQSVEGNSLNNDPANLPDN